MQHKLKLLVVVWLSGLSCLGAGLVNPSITPPGGSTGGPTNGLTAAQVGAAIAATNQAGTLPNNSLTASTVMKADGSKVPSSIGNGAGALTNNGAGVFGWLSLSSFSGGTGTLLPPNALGVLTNNGSGGTNWSSAIPGTWIATGTLPRGAADTSWMSITQAVAYSNSTGLPVIGNTLVIVGTNSYGAVLTAPTNFPSSNIFDSPTNLFNGGTTFFLGTNSYYVTSSGVGFLALGNVPAVGTERWGQLTVVATGDSSWSFAAVGGCKTSYYTNAFVITNGNTGVITIDCQSGVFTNVAIVQFR